MELPDSGKGTLRKGTSPDPLGTHTAQPLEPIKQEAKQGEPLEPVSTFYHNPPTEPVILSPYVEVIDTKQQEIDELSKEITAQATQLTALQQQLSQLANQFQAYITAVHGTNGSN